MKFIVLSPVKHNGKRIEVDAEVEMDEATAAPLVAAGVIEKGALTKAQAKAEAEAKAKAEAEAQAKAEAEAKAKAEAEAKSKAEEEAKSKGIAKK